MVSLDKRRPRSKRREKKSTKNGALVSHQFIINVICAIHIDIPRVTYRQSLVQC